MSRIEGIIRTRHGLIVTVATVAWLGTATPVAAQWGPVGPIGGLATGDLETPSEQTGAAELERHEAVLSRLDDDSTKAFNDYRMHRRNCNSDAVCERHVDEQHTRRIIDIADDRDRENARYEKAQIDIRVRFFEPSARDRTLAAEERQHETARARLEKDGVDVYYDGQIKRRNCRSDALCERNVAEEKTRRTIEIANRGDLENARHDKVMIDLRPPQSTAGLDPAVAIEQQRHEAVLRDLEQLAIDISTARTIRRRNCRSDAPCEQAADNEQADRTKQLAALRDRENAAHAQRGGQSQPSSASAIAGEIQKLIELIRTPTANR
jgi:hypothetical protein